MLKTSKFSLPLTTLTHWLPVYEYIVLGIGEKTGIFWLTYQLH